MNDIPLPEFQGVDDAATTLAKLAEICANGNGNWMAYRAQVKALLTGAFEFGTGVGSGKLAEGANVSLDTQGQVRDRIVIAALQRLMTYQKGPNRQRVVFAESELSGGASLIATMDYEQVRKRIIVELQRKA